MNYYYELADACVDSFGSKYFVAYNRSGDAVMAAGFKLTQMSERVWKESPDNVKFVKNRLGYDVPVDMSEFLLVKLSARNLNA